MSIGDMKQGLTGNRVPLSINPRAPQIHQARVLTYGADKYARGNYHGPAPEAVTPVDRVLGYIDAAQRHLARVADAVNRAKGTGGNQEDGLRIVDDDGGGKFPASNLFDLSHAYTSLGLAITCAVDDGLMPMDPGTPWKTSASEPLPQKADPAAEKEHVKSLESEHYTYRVGDYVTYPDIDGSMIEGTISSILRSATGKKYTTVHCKPAGGIVNHIVGEEEITNVR